MKLFHYAKDGGPDSTVWGYWLIECKRLFSVALLCFEDGSREAYHDHAFNSISWVLKGALTEEVNDWNIWWKVYYPSLRPIVTRRDRMHKVHSSGRTWVLTFRGPWKDEWHEIRPTEGKVTLTHGRKVI